MGLWAPFVTRAMTTGNTLGPYSVAVFLTLGALLSCFIWNVYFMKTSAGWRAGQLQRILSRPASGHMLGRAWRRDLGHGDGLQSGGRELHRRGDFLRDRPVRAHGRRVVGSAGLEGIRRRWQSQPNCILALMFVFYCFAILLVAKANG